MFLLKEESKEVTSKRVYIPKNAQNVFKAMSYIYEPYLDTAEGGKIMKSYASDKAYNLKGDETSNTNGQANAQSISVDVAKMRLSRQNQLDKDSVEYQLYGGDLAHNILKKGVESARAVKTVDKVKPPKPTSDAAKPSKVDIPTIDKANGQITLKLHESADADHPFYEYITDINVGTIIYDFANRESDKQDWAPIIQPSMYEKALQEFTRYGKFINFPTKWVYAWMGIIMRNTAKLMANTELAGHSDYRFDHTEVIDAISSYVLPDNTVFENEDDDDQFSYTMSLEQALQLMTELHIPYGSNDVNDYQAICDEYNTEREYYEDTLRFDETEGCFIRNVPYYEFLDAMGLYDWMELPDGSSGWSDYGINPLQKIIMEYNPNMTPEQVIVIVNRALDVVHMRGDLASIFIEGGRQTLSQISEEVQKKKGKKITLTEKQLKTIKEWLKRQ